MIKYIIGTIIILWSKILYYSKNKNKKSTPRIAPKIPWYRQMVWFYNEPTQILNNLYLGSSFNAYDLELLKNHNINIILNITYEIDNFYQSDLSLTYYKFPIFDNNVDDISKILSITYNIIDHYLNKNNIYSNNKILVHCYMGASRSASVIIYYLMKKYNLSYDKSLNFITKKRPIVNLSKKFDLTLKSSS